MQKLPLPASLGRPLRLFALCLVAACGGSAPIGASVPEAPTSASCSDAASCERALFDAAARADSLRELAEALAAKLDDAAPFRRALADAKLAAARSKGLVVAQAGAAPPKSSLPTIPVAGPLGSTPAAEAALWLAVGEAAGLHYLAVARPDGSTLRVYPGDPLGPLLAGLLPHGVDRAPIDADADLALERALREAFAAAKAFDYVAAADAQRELDGLARKRPRYELGELRARVAWRSLGFWAPTGAEAAPSQPDPPAPAPTADETPYVALLRVRTDPSEAKPYAARRERLLAAVPEDRRAALDAVYQASGAGCGELPLPPYDRPSDLAYASLLPGALLPAGSKHARGRVPLETWLRHHTALVELSQRTGLYFATSHALLAERGATGGVVPSGSLGHRQLDALTKKHLDALTRLSRERPGQIGVSLLPALMSAGVLADEGLRTQMAELAQSAAQSSLREARDPGDLMIALLSGAFSTMSLPPDVRDAYLGALQGSFTAKLRGELKNETGWTVAALYATDAAYRLVTGLSPKLDESSAEISRALESDPSIEQPGLASLVSALARYAALGASKGLGAPILARTDALLPGRAAARASLERALARLAPEGEVAPQATLSELTELVDNFAATAAFALESSPTKSEASCASKEPFRPDPKTQRALSKLRDQQRALLRKPSLAKPTDVWSKRARAVVVLVGDLVDLSERGFEIPDDAARAKPLGVPDAVAREAMHDALASFVEPELAKLGSRSYGLMRAVASRGGSELGRGGLELAQLSTAALEYLVGDEGSSGPFAKLGATLADALQKNQGGELVPALLAASSALSLQGEVTTRDVILLSVGVVQAVREESIPKAALEIAARDRSQTEWMLHMLDETGRLKRGEPVSVGGFRPGLEAALARECATASVPEIVEVYAALESRRAGRKKEASEALAKALARAERTLVVPRASYHFRRETEQRVLDLRIDLGLGSVMLQNANAFNAGGGLRTTGEAKTSFELHFTSAESKQTLDDTARFWVRAQALLAIWQFADGEQRRGEQSAAKLLGVLTRRSWLGASGLTDEPTAWAADSRASLLVLAQLAADGGRPLLAGALLGLVRGTLDPQTDDATLASTLEEAPEGLGEPSLRPVVERARGLAKRVAQGLPCVTPAAGPGLPFASLSCESYPLELGLRAAEATSLSPRLAPSGGGRGSSCPDLAALDGFLRPAMSGTYDPDRFAEAATQSLELGKPVEAALLLVAHRQPNHCSATIEALLRRVAQEIPEASSLRADLYSSLLNCSKASVSESLLDDLVALDVEATKLGDTIRRLELASHAAALTLNLADPRPLAVVVRRPDFVEPTRQLGPRALGIALLLEQAASVLEGKPLAPSQRAAEVELLCGPYPAADRKAICEQLTKLRSTELGVEPRKDLARATLTALLSSLSGP